MSKKAKELPNIMALASAKPKAREGEIPHWKVWRWARKHPGRNWRRTPTEDE